VFRERKQVVICLIAIVSVGGFVLFRFLPMYKTFKAVEQLKTAQRLIIAKGISDSEQLPLFMDQLIKFKAGIGDYENSIPQQKTLGLFVHQMADLMNQHQLEEQEIAPGAETEAEGLNCIPVSIQCKGQLEQIFTFFRELQALDRLIRIQQVKLLNDQNFRGQVSLETDVVIYYKAAVVPG
jgi:Tfp pilus assembly protein PilO